MEPIPYPPLAVSQRTTGLSGVSETSPNFPMAIPTLELSRGVTLSSCTSLLSPRDLEYPLPERITARLLSLTGSTVGMSFNVTGTVSGQAITWFGLFDSTYNTFRIYDSDAKLLGTLGNP